MIVDKLTIRQGTSQDHQPLVELLESHQMTSDINPCEFFVATLSGKLVGAARVEKENENLYMRPLVVDSAYQAKGIGKALVRNLLSQSPNLRVVARGSAIGFYRHMGFETLPGELIPECYRHECELCTDHERCQPAPMVYIDV